MKDIKLTEEQRKKYPFLADLLDFSDEVEDTKDYLEQIEEYLEYCEQTAINIYIKTLLLGDTSIPTPNKFSWSDEEKVRLVDRWEIINRMHTLSLMGMFEEEEEDEEEDPGVNNDGGGFVS